MSKQKSPGRRSVRAKRLKAHAQGRGHTRYNLNEQQLLALKKRIEAFLSVGRPLSSEIDIVVLEVQSKIRTKFAVLHEGNWLPVIYDKKARQLATILPQAALGSFEPPRPATEEEQKDAWLNGGIIPITIVRTH